MFEKLSNNEKGNIELYDWDEDLGKEIFENKTINIKIIFNKF